MDVENTSPAPGTIERLFDEFLDRNKLRDYALHAGDEAEIERRLMAAPLPDAVMRDLASIVDVMPYPLAIRS